MIKTSIMHDEKTDYIKVENGRLTVILSSIGAGVWKVLWDGNLINLAPKREMYPEDTQFNGKTLARTAGRIPCDITINGKNYHLKEQQQGFCIHGGKMNSMSFKIFDYSIINADSKTLVEFTLTDKDGENGYPGNLETKITYEFIDGKNQFTIRYHATTDKDTVVSFSNHLYWDINGIQNISNDSLYINASKWGTNDGKSQLVTGIDNVPECMDFRSMSVLGPKLDVIEKTIWEKTIDHLFVFDKVQEDKPQVIYKGGKVKLSLFTDFEAINIYADASCSKYEFENAEGLILHNRRALALEPQQIALGLSHITLKAGDSVDHYETYLIEDND